MAIATVMAATVKKMKSPCDVYRHGQLAGRAADITTATSHTTHAIKNIQAVNIKRLDMQDLLKLVAKCDRQSPAATNAFTRDFARHDIDESAFVVDGRRQFDCGVATRRARPCRFSLLAPCRSLLGFHQHAYPPVN